ncbi:MAG: YdhK family protein [Oenococcus sp.]
MDMGSDGNDDNADNNLLPAVNPLYPEGTEIKVLADHMPGMQGANGVVTHAYISNVYIIDYDPTDGSPEVKGHRWVTEDEIQNADSDSGGQETNATQENKKTDKSELKNMLALLF